VHQVGRDSRRYSARARLDYGVRACLRLRELVKRYRIEVVDGLHEGTDALLYSFWKLTPFVVQVHGSIRGYMKTNSSLPKMETVRLRALLFLSDITARRADMVVAISPVAHEEMLKVVGVAPRKLKLVYHGRDLARYRFTPSNIRERLGISSSIPLVASFGRLEARKGVHVLCQAIPEVLATFPAAKFLLLGRDTPTAPGGGSFKAFVSRELHAPGVLDNTIFIDYLSDDELVQLYSACDLVVCPSLHEVASSIPLEAMACGKPVVATPVGIVPDLELGGTNGEVVPVGDAKALAAGIIRILGTVCASDEERTRIAQRNRDIVERRASVTKWAADMAAIYAQTLQSWGGRMS
jgi:glycosyltransferase involved in cell wall biosynthesis